MTTRPPAGDADRVDAAQAPARTSSASDAAGADAWVDAATFHAGPARIHTAREGEPASLVKRRADLAHVAYSPAHPNPALEGWPAGRGTARTVWLASEQPGTNEGLWSGSLVAAFDTTLEPGAAIGWHRHDGTDELYLLLDGSLTVRAGRDPDGAAELLLAPGDVHRVPSGWGHAALAGPNGARIVVVETRA